MWLNISFLCSATSLISERPVVQVEAAVAAAKEAFPAWSERSPEQRAQVLNKLADLIQDNLEPLAQAESRDQGLLGGLGQRVRAWY